MGLTSHERAKLRKQRIQAAGVSASQRAEKRKVLESISRVEEACRNGPYLIFIQDPILAKASRDYYRKIANLPIEVSKQ